MLFAGDLKGSFFRLRSKAEITVGPDHFRFAPNSRHWLARSAGPFGTTSSHVPLLDHLVSKREQRGGNCDTKGLCRFKVDHEFELGRLPNREIGWFVALENATN